MPLNRRHFFAAPLGLLPAWPGVALARNSALPITLAQDAPPGMDPAGHLVSEKYDGVRAYWDGASLRFRSGLPVAAPAWFLAALPATPLDGELWLAPGRFEALVGAVRRQRPLEAEWRAIRYMVFDLPGAAGRFAERAARIAAMFQSTTGPVVAVAQQRMTSRAALDQQLQAVIAAGGEGLMLHRADAPHTPGRSGVLFKLKPRADAEAQVIGHVPGRGKHEGRLGALRVRTADGVVFLIGTGFSDAERAAPPAVGQWVTFTYRGLTEAGVPRFASYLRPRVI
jgi:DNA ligase 1